MVAKSGSNWHLAPALVDLIDEVDAKWPKRSRSVDGSIGDASHAARYSEHNPDRDPDPMPRGAVSALDITATDSKLRAELLDELIGDPRVWYVINRGKIWSRTDDGRPWDAEDYNGNPHKDHIHVSLVQSKTAHDDRSRWLKAAKPPAPRPGPKPEGPRGPGHVPGTRVLSVGDEGSDVALVQRFLGIKDDGIFGPQTRKNVIRYQDLRGLIRDGVVGPKTWRPILRDLGLDGGSK